MSIHNKRFIRIREKVKNNYLQNDNLDFTVYLKHSVFDNTKDFEKWIEQENEKLLQKENESIKGAKI